MDEPSDFAVSVASIGTVTLTSNCTHPNAVVAAGWYMLEREDGTVAIVPTKEAAQKLTPPRRLEGRAGYERHRAQPTDGMERETELAQAIKRLADWHKATEGGNHVANAITALHGQRRADGRPEFFIPEIG